MKTGFDVLRSVPPVKKGARYFLRFGHGTGFAFGWSKKSDFEAWMEERRDWIDWRVGTRFRIKGLTMDCVLVTRKGEQA